MAARVARKEVNGKTRASLLLMIALNEEDASCARESRESVSTLVPTLAYECRRRQCVVRVKSSFCPFERLSHSSQTLDQVLPFKWLFLPLIWCRK